MSFSVGVVGLVGGIPAGLAGPHGEVVSAFDPDDGFDLHLSLEYGFEMHRASVRREQAGLPGTQPTDPLPIVKDLYFEGNRHSLVPRLDVGLFTDLSLSVELPVVLYDGRSLFLDQRASPCVFPGGGAQPNCIDRSNSSTVQDGILPANGFDAGNPGGSGLGSGALIFRGPDRGGLDQVHVGLTWAPMNQARDDTKPTWKLGAQGRLAIGAPMRLDRQAPGNQTSVGRGLHEVRLWTSFARQIGRTEPYMHVWWQGPVAEVEGSAFAPLGHGQQRPGARHHGGIDFGLAAKVWERPAAQQVVHVDAGAHLEARFEGRAYSEMWEVFQYAGTPGQGGPLVLDADPAQAGQQALLHPGVTTVENHLRMGGDIAARAQLGRFQVGAALELMYTQPHVITFSDAGEDLPTCGAGVQPPCEDQDNTLVNTGTEEVNPGYVSLIDFVGQRYRVDEVFDYVLRIEARMLF